MDFADDVADAEHTLPSLWSAASEGRTSRSYECLEAETTRCCAGSRVPQVRLRVAELGEAKSAIVDTIKIVERMSEKARLDEIACVVDELGLHPRCGWTPLLGMAQSEQQFQSPLEG